MTPARAEEDVVIVGAGIVGVACAALLTEAGRRALVIDRAGVCAEASAGNAAALAFTDILPLAQKGMMRQAPRWLLDPLGPLAIPPAYLPRLVPWLFRFWRAGAPKHHRRSVNAQAALMRLAEAEWLALMDRAGAKNMLREDGSLELYESEAEFSRSLPGWAERERHGIPFEHVAGARLTELQPGLSPRFVKGTFAPGWKTVSDPQAFGCAVWAYAQAQGARFEQGLVRAVEPGRNGAARLTLESGRALEAKTLVIAAGAWSHRLARLLGDRVPLETERGYNTTLPPGAFDVKRQLIFSGHGFVVTPLETGLRIGGAVELGGLERPPNFSRAKAMLRKAATFLPGLKTEGGREWMGFRPSLPDSLPVIDRAGKASNVFYAFGHGHLGLTQAAATARLIHDLVLGHKPALDLSPFSVQRF